MFVRPAKVDEQELIVVNNKCFVNNPAGWKQKKTWQEEEEEDENANNQVVAENVVWWSLRQWLNFVLHVDMINLWSRSNREQAETKNDSQEGQANLLVSENVDKCSMVECQKAEKM